MLLSAIKKISPYRISVALSSLSVLFGLGREFLIIAMLGFSASNDQLQIYLSIYYSIALSGDAVRLAALNLCEKASFAFILLCATLICAPFTIIVGLLVNYLAGGLNLTLLWIAITGSFLNLIALLVVTYKQRFGGFLPAQLINLSPNFVLIPGILIAYFFAESQLVAWVVGLCCLTSVLQLLLLPWVKIKQETRKSPDRQIKLREGIFVFARHGVAMLGEQLFQLLTRAAFFKLGAGYLSVLAMSVRVYAAARVVLVDSYIGSKLASWGNDLQKGELPIELLLKSVWLQRALLLITCGVVCYHRTALSYFSVQLAIIFIISFYLCSLVRVIYFKINHGGHDPNLVVRFGFYELLFAGLSYLVVTYTSLPLMVLMGLWYVAKPYAQLELLRPKFNKLQVAD